MRDFSKVSPSIWGKGKFKSLTTSEKLVYLYLMTSPHQNSAGCHHLPDAYAAADMGMAEDEYVAIRQKLEALDIIAFDEETSEVYVCGWFVDNPVTNEKHKIGVERIIIDRINSIKIADVADKELQDNMNRVEKARIAKEAKLVAARNSRGD